MFKFLRKNKFFLIALIFFIFVPFLVFAQVDISDDLGTTFGLGTQGLKTIIIKIVNATLGFLGIIATSVILYGGFIWMTSGGNMDKVDKAKKILINGMIGLAIILLSFAIVRFVTGGILGGNNGNTNPGNSGPGSGALGNGIVESIYPNPGQRDVARNTPIVVTFKEAIELTSIIEDTSGNGILGDCLDAGGSITNCDTVLIVSGEPVVKLAKQGEIISGPYVVPLSVETNDSLTFIFTPQSLLGNISYNEWYSVELTNNILKNDSTPAFGAFGGFDWSFEVGTYIDTTPPYVTRVFPPDGGTYARNVVIQIQFSEAINPISVTNNNIIIDDSTAPPSPSVSGDLYISNQYRTVEFLGTPCGTNSCNEIIYCLPAMENITVTALAASLTAEPPLAQKPYNGVVDMVGNSLDGNHNGLAEGSSVDDYSWNFNINDSVELTPPTIVGVSPVFGERGVALKKAIEVTFSELIMQSSLRSSNIKILEPLTSFWLTAEDAPFAFPTHTVAYVNHKKFTVITDYKTEVNSGVKDMYQNCLFPSEGPGCIAPAPVGLDCCCNEIWSVCPCL